MDISGKIKTGIALIPAYVTAFAVNVFATAPSDAASVIGQAGSNDKVESVGTTVKGVVGTVYSAATTIGVIIAVIALIVAFVRIAINRSSQKRELAKDSIIWICVALVLIGGSIAIVSALMGVGAQVTTGAAE